MGTADFEAAFDRLFARAYAVTRRFTDPAAAEDLAAEALARTYARWRRVRDYEHLDAWVARVAINLAIDHVRRRPRPTIDHVADPSDAAVLRIALVDALRRLPRRQREAIALRYFADMSIDDVASSLGVTAGTVKSSVHRALASLREHFGPELAYLEDGG